MNEMFHLVIFYYGLIIVNPSLQSYVFFFKLSSFFIDKVKKICFLSQNEQKNRAHPQKGRAQIIEIVNLSAIIQLLLARS